MTTENPKKRRHVHLKLVRRLTLFAIGMFGFGFAMWPIYNVFCDLTGLGGRGVKVMESAGEMQQSDRQVKLRFDASVNSGLPWVFQAEEKFVKVSLGEMSEAKYFAMNKTDETLVGRAIYNVTPPEASLYFVKTECFCFTEQVLLANESKEMPVYYFIQPGLPDYIKEITLSYTFFLSPTSGALTQESGLPGKLVADGNRE